MNSTNRLSIDFDWREPRGTDAPEIDATWAMLSIRVGDVVVTSASDRRAKSHHSSVFVPLYPLAEWIAFHWWFLLFEPARERARTAGTRWRSRHSFAAAREGFALPALAIWSFGRHLQMEWQPEKLEAARLTFTEGGMAFADRDDSASTLFDFVEAVIARLEVHQVRETPLQVEWRAIHGTTGEERAFCELAAQLGVDPYAVADDDADAIERIRDELPGTIVSDFCSAVDLRSVDAELSAMAEALERARTSSMGWGGGFERWYGPVDAGGGGTSAQPWSEGWTVARRLRRQLDIGIKPLRSFEALAEAFELGAVEDLGFVRAELATHAMDAVVAPNAEGRPVAVLRARREASERFHYCRALYERLTRPRLSMALVNRAQLERQSRSRAFAAEFLAPIAGIEARLPTTVVADDDVEEIAEHYGVSSLVIEHQIENHGFARVA